MSQKPKSKYVELQIPEGIEQVLIYRERKPTGGEMSNGGASEGDIVTENILITFDGHKKPEVSINADICTPDEES